MRTLDPLTPLQGASPAKRPPAPKGLAAAGKRLWRAVVDDYDLGPGDDVLLAEACRVVDRIDRLAVADADLVVAGSKGQPVVNGLGRELREERLLLAHLLERLGFDGTGPWDGLSASQRARKAARRAGAEVALTRRARADGNPWAVLRAVTALRWAERGMAPGRWAQEALAPLTAEERRWVDDCVHDRLPDPYRFGCLRQIVERRWGPHRCRGSALRPRLWTTGSPVPSASLMGLRRVSLAGAGEIRDVGTRTRLHPPPDGSPPPLATAAAAGPVARAAGASSSTPSPPSATAAPLPPSASDPASPIFTRRMKAAGPSPATPTAHVHPARRHPPRPTRTLHVQRLPGRGGGQ